LTIDNTESTIFRAAEAPPGPLSSKERGKRGLGVKGVRCMKIMKNDN